MFWQRLRTFFEPSAGDATGASLVGAVSASDDAEHSSQLHGADAAAEGQDEEELDLLSLQAEVEAKLAEAHASLWDFDLDAAEQTLQRLRRSPHPLVHLLRAQLLAMKLLVGGSDQLLTEAIQRCDEAAKHARAMAHKARERQGRLGEMPVHLSACFVVECTVTEAEALLLAAGLEMYRKGYVPTARLLQTSWRKYKMLRSILAQVRNQSKEPGVPVEDGDDDAERQDEAVQKLKALIDEKTAFIRSLNVDRHGVIPEMVLAHTNELLRLKQLFKELTGGWVSSDGHAISNIRRPTQAPAKRAVPAQQLLAAVKEETESPAAVAEEEKGGDTAEEQGEEGESKSTSSEPKKQGIFKQSSFRDVLSAHAKRFTLGGKGHRRTNPKARKMRPQIKHHSRKKSNSSGHSRTHTRSHTFSDLQAQLEDPTLLPETEGLAHSSLSIEDGEVLIRAVFGDDAASPAAVASPEAGSANGDAAAASQRAQEYQKELLKVVAELARRIDFGLAIFHLISSFASKSLSWAISLVGAPNDPATALRLLVKVHRHGGMRGQLASLLLLALPPHLQQLIPAAIDSRASPTALVALVEAHVHMRIPKSPFLYWLLARSEGTSSHLTTSRLELAKRALEYAAPVRDDSAILREFLAFLSLAQAKWTEAAEHALHVSVSPPGRRQCRFLASLYRVAALAAQEVLGIVSEDTAAQATSSPKNATTILQAKLNRPRRPSGTKTNMKSWTLGPMRRLSQTENGPESELLGGSSRRSSVLSRDDATENADSNAWSLLQHTISTIQPLESEEFAKRRAAAYLKRGCDATSGLWLLAPEIVYCFYRGQPHADQVNHLEMLRLLDLGALALAKESSTNSRFPIISDLIMALVSNSQQVLAQYDALGESSAHVDLEVFHEVSTLGTPSIRFRLQSEATASISPPPLDGTVLEANQAGPVGDVVVSWFLLRGCALRSLSRVLEASLMFRLVTSFQAFVTESAFVVPVALILHAEMVADRAKTLSNGEQLCAVRAMLDRAEHCAKALRAWDYEAPFSEAIEALKRKLPTS